MPVTTLARIKNDHKLQPELLSEQVWRPENLSLSELSSYESYDSTTQRNNSSCKKIEIVNGHYLVR